MNEVKNLKIANTTIAISIIMLTLTAAGAHFYLAAQPDEELHFIFLLNGLGYLGLLAAFFLPLFKSLHRIIGWILFGYTLLTIIMWFILGGPKEGEWDPFDVTVKAVEITLAIQLFLINRKQSARS